MAKIPPPNDPIPQHIAIIMDGNGRWAQMRGLPRLAGHHEGAKAVRRVVTYAREIGVRYLTLYAFSSENWKRPKNEISGLMLLLHDYLQTELKTMCDNGIRLNIIGATERLPDFVCEALEKTCAATAQNDGMVLTLALSYGGRDEILRAVRSLASDVEAGTLCADDIDEQQFAQRLDTADLPDPDLLIRTSGENRVSNFLLWQIAYTEFFSTPGSWPEFDEQALYDAINCFQARERRFGLTGEQVKTSAGKSEQA